MQPRRGSEAVWELSADAVQPMPNFGSHPVSPRYRDPDRLSRVRDALVAAALVLALLCAAGAYVSGVFVRHGGKTVPAQTQDPFAFISKSGRR